MLHPCKKIVDAEEEFVKFLLGLSLLFGESSEKKNTIWIRMW
jgi:hypothetical protein